MIWYSMAKVTKYSTHGFTCNVGVCRVGTPGNSRKLSLEGIFLRIPKAVKNYEFF